MINKYSKECLNSFSLSKDNLPFNYKIIKNDKIATREILLNQISFIDSNIPELLFNKYKSIMFIYSRESIVQYNQLKYREHGKRIQIEQPNYKILYETRQLKEQFTEIKIFYNEIKKVFMCLISTVNLVLFSHDITTQDPKIIFQIPIEKIYIKKIFLCDFSNDADVFYLLLSNNMLIQINLTEDSSNNLEIFDFIQNKEGQNSNNIRRKNQTKQFFITNTQYKKNEEIIFQHFFYEFKIEKSNIISAFSFGNNINTKEKITNVKIFKMLYMAICVEGGVVYLLNILNNLYKIISAYHANYGRIASVSFSNDGNLLGISTEDNNAYIVDISSKKIISCLVGHRNYITNLIFEAQNNNINNFIHPNTNLYFQSNISNNNYYGGGENKSPMSNIGKIKPMEKIKDDFIKQWEKELKTNTKKPLQLTQIYRSNSLMNPPYSPSVKIYDIYTSGLDGYIGSYRIEYNETSVNSGVNTLENISRCQSDIPTSRDPSQLKQLKHFKREKQFETFDEYVLYDGNDEDNLNFEINHYLFMNRVINEPIIYMFKNENIISFISKQNSSGTDIKVIFYEVEDSYNNENKIFLGEKNMNFIPSEEQKPKNINQRVYNPPLINTSIKFIKMQINEINRKKGKLKIDTCFSNNNIFN